MNKQGKISGDKQGIAAEMIERMKPLYALEARLREVTAHHRTRKLDSDYANKVLDGLF
jgi:hypothetical protein